jgi:endonuclease YncB( thermonuclease family)
VFYASCALWLALGLTSGVSGVVLMAATLMLAVGLVALIAGRARWAFIGNRKLAAIVTGGSLLVGIIGGAAVGDTTTTDDGTDAPAATSTLGPTEPPSPSPTDTARTDSVPSTPPTNSAPTGSAATPPPRAAPKPASAAAATVQVTDVVDGDTLIVSTGRHVRVIGIDTPERGDCGYAAATRTLEALVLGRPVVLTAAPSKDDKDQYGRLLRYVDIRGVDAGLNQIKKGLAVARYDSRDGYGAHPREPWYIKADRAAANITCAAKPSVTPKPTPRPTKPPAAGNGCHPSYIGACLPIGPDIDCADVPMPVRVVGPDEYRLDADHDGIGCESS